MSIESYGGNVSIKNDTNRSELQLKQVDINLRFKLRFEFRPVSFIV